MYLLFQHLNKGKDIMRCNSTIAIISLLVGLVGMVASGSVLAMARSAWISAADVVAQLVQPDFEQQLVAWLNNRRSEGPYSALNESLFFQRLVEGRPERPAVVVRGIYLTSYVASIPRYYELVDLIRRTELNAMVIDIKDDHGRLTYESQLPNYLANKAVSGQIKDIGVRLEALHAAGGYAIARIVCFKDSKLATARPDLAIQRADGSPWRDSIREAWLNPYKEETWAYIVDVAEEAAKLGFDEIQFDYVRFPSDGRLSEMIIETDGVRTRARVIKDFLAYARQRLKPYDVFISADVFGLVTTFVGEGGIGQNWEMLVEELDVISPMMYPSHYGPGNYGIPDPNSAPYATIYARLGDALRRTREGQAVIRPWIQDFSLGYHYGPAEVRAQIQAIYDRGLNQWLLWNAYSRYTEAALLPGRE